MEIRSNFKRNIPPLNFERFEKNELEKPSLKEEETSPYSPRPQSSPLYKFNHSNSSLFGNTKFRSESTVYCLSPYQKYAPSEDVITVPPSSPENPIVILNLNIKSS